ncbi:hypothetical protein B0H17DRAFT_1208115 [Mycena rosella]|uniref:Uncharacterized protein n=1 Tax=Mycena rosella TaxID=1033263 RepID=A0AAD7D1H0_MYCRO|nr:hypothetical protein B0H17DRAFT_1208115 [Mycena rosella]
MNGTEANKKEEKKETTHLLKPAPLVFRLGLAPVDVPKLELEIELVVPAGLLGVVGAGVVSAFGLGLGALPGTFELLALLDVDRLNAVGLNAVVAAGVVAAAALKSGLDRTLDTKQEKNKKKNTHLPNASSPPRVFGLSLEFAVLPSLAVGTFEPALALALLAVAVVAMVVVVVAVLKSGIDRTLVSDLKRG